MSGSSQRLQRLLETYTKLRDLEGKLEGFTSSTSGWDTHLFDILAPDYLWPNATMDNIALISVCVNSLQNETEFLATELTSIKQRYVKSIKALIRKCEEFITIITLDPDFHRNNFMEVNVFFNELSTEVTKQIAAYEFWSFLSNLGGTVGLWLGFSLATGVELIFILYSHFIYTTFFKCLAFFKGKRGSQASNDDDDKIGTNGVVKNVDDPESPKRHMSTSANGFGGPKPGEKYNKDYRSMSTASPQESPRNMGKHNANRRHTGVNGPEGNFDKNKWRPTAIGKFEPRLSKNNIPGQNSKPRRRPSRPGEISTQLATPPASGEMPTKSGASRERRRRSSQKPAAFDPKIADIDEVDDPAFLEASYNDIANGLQNERETWVNNLQPKRLSPTNGTLKPKPNVTSIHIAWDQ